MKNFILMFMLLTNVAFAQNVGINATGASPNPSAGLDIDFTTKGTLITRMTTAQRDGIAAACSCTPAAGLQIFNTTTNCLELYALGLWQPIYCACNGAPATPGTVSGSASVCPAQSGVVYSISPVSGANSYTWSLPPGSSISSGQGTTSATITFGSTSGNVSVVANNNCGTSGTSTLSVTVNSAAIPTATAATAIALRQFTANWNTASGATSYALDVATDNNFVTGLIISNQNVGNVLTYNVTGLTPGTTYYYRVRAVNSCVTSGNSNTITATTTAITVKVLVVAGGGGAGTGSQHNGGGGAGGLLYETAHAITAQAYSVTVGAKAIQTGNGGNSVFDNMTAIGGGHGAYASTVAGNGGSGGGAAPEHTTGGTGTGGQGNAGGNSTGGVGGAGGGAGGSGAGNVGGPGVSNSISGTAVTYAGGGKPYMSGTNGAGYNEYGGGADGDVGTSVKDGIVIIAAPIGTITSATGGSHTTAGGNDIWTFTTSGTWTPTF